METRGVVDWYTKIPRDTPFARSVTVDPVCAEN
jgi:hypothetical protein